MLRCDSFCCHLVDQKGDRVCLVWLGAKLVIGTLAPPFCGTLVCRHRGKNAKFGTRDQLGGCVVSIWCGQGCHPFDVPLPIIVHVDYMIGFASVFYETCFLFYSQLGTCRLGVVVLYVIIWQEIKRGCFSFGVWASGKLRFFKRTAAKSCRILTPNGLSPKRAGAVSKAMAMGRAVCVFTWYGFATDTLIQTGEEITGIEYDIQ